MGQIGPFPGASDFFNGLLARIPHQIPTAGRKRRCGLRLCSGFDPQRAFSTPAVESFRTPCHSDAYDSSLQNLVRNPGYLERSETAASSGATELMNTPVAHSNPASVVSRGRISTCQ